MAENLVSQPPLNTPLVDSNGMPTRALSIWMRDVYRRIAYKGGNAIDDNKAETDNTIDDNKAETDNALIGIGSTLEETIAQVNENIGGTSLNAENLENHEALEEAHGSNGSIVGFDDVSDESTFGLVKRMVSIDNAVYSTVNIVTTDIDPAPAVYDQAYTQLVTELTNENKAAINQLASDLNDAIAVLNNLLEESKNSGQMTT